MKRKLYTVNQKGNDTRFPSPFLGNGVLCCNSIAKKRNKSILGTFFQLLRWAKEAGNVVCVTSR